MRMKLMAGGVLDGKEFSCIDAVYVELLPVHFADV